MVSGVFRTSAYGAFITLLFIKNRLRTTKYRLRTTKHRRRTTKHRLRTTKDCLRTTKYCLRTTKYCLRITKYCLRTTKYSLRTTKYCLRTHGHTRFHSKPQFSLMISIINSPNLYGKPPTPLRDLGSKNLIFFSKSAFL